MTSIRIEFDPDMSEAQAAQAAQAMGVVVEHTSRIGSLPTVWGTVEAVDHDAMDADDRVAWYQVGG